MATERSGYVGNLSPEQEEALRQLRETVSGETLPEDDDYFFLRWLRARDFNVPKAESMLRKHLAMRKELGADTILQDYQPLEVLTKCFPGGFFGEDREGHPVWYDNFGNLDFRGLHRSVTKHDLLCLKCFEAEKMVAMMKDVSAKKGKHMETIDFVVDLENISIQRHYYWPGIEILRAIVTWLEDNYPERIGRIILIKAPAVFPMMYGLVKFFIDEKTRSKITVCGKGDYQEVLQHYIAPDQIPQAYGGLRCEPDPMCTNYINPGCNVPEQFYLTAQISREEMERVVIRSGSKHKVVYRVHEPNSILQWEFTTTNHDIGFGVSYRSSGREKKEYLIKVQRKQSDIVPESGTLECSNTGLYILNFDNSYSWVREKELYYRAEVLPPHSTPTVHSIVCDQDNNDSTNREC